MTTSPITETSVGNWMLPESRQTQARIEHAVTQTTANNQSAGPLRTLGVVVTSRAGPGDRGPRCGRR